MKKTKHLGLAVALAAMLAIGAGAGLISEVGKGVGAAGDISVAMTGYAGGTESKKYIETETADTFGGVTFMANNYMPGIGQIRGNQTSVAKNFYIYNTTPLPRPLKQVVITVTEGNFKAGGVTYLATGTASQSAADDKTAGMIEGTYTPSEQTMTWDLGETSTATYFKILSKTKFGYGNLKSTVIDLTLVSDGGGTAPTPVDPTALTMQPGDAAEVGISGTVQLSVTAEPAGASNAVTWTSGDETIATVSASGLVTGVAAGTVTITATSKVAESVSATCSVTVKPAATVGTAYRYIDLTYHDNRGQNSGYADVVSTGVNPAAANSIAGEWFGGNSYKNASDWNSVKFGQVAKNTSTITDCYLSTAVAIDKKITKVGVSIVKYDNDDYGKLKDISIYVADEPASGEEISWSTEAVASKTIDAWTAPVEEYLEIPAAAQAESKLYKALFTFTLIKTNTTSKNKNGLVWIDKLNFYQAESVEALHDVVQGWVDGYMHMSDYGTENKGWCKDSDHHYYDDAKAALLALEAEHPGAIQCFQDDASFDAAQARYEAWAAANMDYKLYESGESGKGSADPLPSELSSVIAIIAVIGVVSISAISLLVLKRKRAAVR